MPLLTQSTFASSKNLYALEPASFEAVELEQTHDGYDMWMYTINAMWFRRRSSLTQAMFGTLREYSTARPNESTGARWRLADFIKHYRAHGGGTPLGRWNGQAPWFGGEIATDYARQQVLLPKLQEALANYPEVPAGYVGWYLATN